MLSSLCIILEGKGSHKNKAEYDFYQDKRELEKIVEN